MSHKENNAVLAKQFATFVIPSMLAFALSGVYAIADGFFVGNANGDSALAAINVAYPMTSLLQGIGSGVGMGGAVGYTISKGQGNRQKSDEFFSLAMLMLLISSLIIIPVYLLSYRSIISFFGAEGVIQEMAEEYIFYITIGAFFQILATGMVPFIRNLGLSIVATASMMTGFVMNIILDWLFVWIFDWGVTGAAVASVLGQAATFIICLCAIIARKQKFTLHFTEGTGEKVLSILKVGVAPFGLVLSPNISIVLMNKFLSIYGGSFAVTCYAVISYITIIILLLMQGIGDGLQPLFSLYFAKQEVRTVVQLRRMGYIFSFIVIVLTDILLYRFRYSIPLLFGSSPEVVAAVGELMPVFLYGLLFTGISRVTMSYYYATEKSSLSYVLVYGELLILFLFQLVLSPVIGINGTWYATPLSQAVISAVAAFLVLAERRKNR